MGPRCYSHGVRTLSVTCPFLYFPCRISPCVSRGSYAARYLTARSEDELPIDMCKPIVRLLLDLLRDLSLHHGEVRDLGGMSLADVCQEANRLDTTQFARLYGAGELDAEAQRLAVDLKVVDALVACVLAPYNRVFFSREHGGPFGAKPASNLPSAVHRFLCVPSPLSLVPCACVVGLG